MDTHIPCKIMRPYKDIPWLNDNIKSKMQEQKRLYDLAKASKNPNVWHLYSETRNNVGSLLKSAYITTVAICVMILIQIIISVFGFLLKGFTKTIQEYHL